MGWHEEHAEVKRRAEEAQAAAQAAIQNEYTTRQRVEQLEALQNGPLWLKLGWLLLGQARMERIWRWLRARREGFRGLRQRIPWLRTS